VQGNQQMTLGAEVPQKESRLGKRASRSHTKVNRDKCKALPWAGKAAASG